MKYGWNVQIGGCWYNFTQGKQRLRKSVFASFNTILYLQGSMSYVFYILFECFLSHKCYTSVDNNDYYQH